jgi:hypothetical protein
MPSRANYCKTIDTEKEYQYREPHVAIAVTISDIEYQQLAGTAVSTAMHK